MQPMANISYEEISIIERGFDFARARLHDRMTAWISFSAMDERGTVRGKLTLTMSQHSHNVLGYKIPILFAILKHHRRSFVSP